MAKVEKKICYRPVPVGARIVESTGGVKYAVWFHKGQEITAEYVETANGPRVKKESDVFIAYYRDADGQYRERSTKCRDRKAAEFKLQQWLQEIEKIKAGIMTQDESDASQRRNDKIADHLDAFKEYLKTRSKSRSHVSSTIKYVEKVCEECGFVRLRDLNPDVLITWLNKKVKQKMSARNVNAHRGALIHFAEWAEMFKRITFNPLRRIPKMKEKLDKRHERRALTLDEIAKLLDAAEKRPLHEKTLVRTGGNSGQNLANVREEIKEEARLLGFERKLIYAALIYTGLRKSELKSITVGQVFLNDKIPHVVLKNQDSKNGEGGVLPLHPTLVTHLRDWFEIKKAKGRCKPKDKLFNVYDSLCHVLNRDLVFAGIPKKDTLDRVIDVHALRHTHCTILQNQAGVGIGIAQKSMRHSSIDMTMNYTHTDISSVAEGINRLPDFLEEKKNDETQNDELQN